MAAAAEAVSAAEAVPRPEHSWRGGASTRGFVGRTAMPATRETRIAMAHAIAAALSLALQRGVLDRNAVGSAQLFEAIRAFADGRVYRPPDGARIINLRGDDDAAAAAYPANGVARTYALRGAVLRGDALVVIGSDCVIVGRGCVVVGNNNRVCGRNNIVYGRDCTVDGISLSMSSGFTYHVDYDGLDAPPQALPSVAEAAAPSSQPLRRDASGCGGSDATLMLTSAWPSSTTLSGGGGGGGGGGSSGRASRPSSRPSSRTSSRGASPVIMSPAVAAVEASKRTAVALPAAATSVVAPVPTRAMDGAPHEPARRGGISHTNLHYNMQPGATLVLRDLHGSAASSDDDGGGAPRLRRAHSAGAESLPRNVSPSVKRNVSPSVQRAETDTATTMLRLRRRLSILRIDEGAGAGAAHGT